MKPRRLELVAAPLNVALLAGLMVAVGGPAALAHNRCVPIALGFLALARIGDALREPAASATEVHGGTASTAWARVLCLATGLSMLAVEIVALLAGRFSSPSILAASVGSGMLLGGIALRFLAQRTLGARFSDDHLVAHGGPLEVHGVYERFRHPSELGLLLISLGTSVLLGSAWAVGLWAFTVLPLTAARLRGEEAALARRYGREFFRYRARTHFVPTLGA